MAQKKVIDFTMYQRLLKYSYNEMNRFLISVTENYRDLVLQEAEEKAHEKLFGDAEITVLDEDEVITRLLTVDGITEDKARQILQILEEGKNSDGKPSDGKPSR